MSKTLVTLPCTAQELENALHAVCDHGGLWDEEVRVCLHTPQDSALVIETETEGESR